MGDGATVSAAPMEWRARVRAAAQAHPVPFCESDIGQRVLFLREQLKTAARTDRTPRRVRPVGAFPFSDRSYFLAGQFSV